MSDLKAVQVESEKQRAQLVALATEYHSVGNADIAGTIAEYRELVPDLPRPAQDRWWNQLVVAAGEIERLEVEKEHDWSHLSRRAAANALPAARELLRQTAYFALMSNATTALLKEKADQMERSLSEGGGSL